MTFWAYDDGSSTYPTIKNPSALKIINGKEFGFRSILEKYESGKELSLDEEDLIKRICKEEPDCLAYESVRRKNGMNYLFFEKGFNKLSIHDVSIRLGDHKGENHNRIQCAYSSDYMPCVEAYGYYFMPILKVGYSDVYKENEEYISRKAEFQQNLKRVQEGMK